MKDYLAYALAFSFWKDILRRELTDEAENLLSIIKANNKDRYEKSYAIVRKLVERGKVTNASVMVEMVNAVNVTFADKFKSKFLEEGEPEESADIKIDDDMVFFLSKRVVTNWKRFARNLELRDEEIDEIEETQESFGDKFIAVITKFNADGGNLKWIQTKAVLEEIGLTKVMLEFKNEYLKNRPAVNLFQ